MARKIKIDNAIQKRFNKEKNKQKNNTSREVKVYFLIVCEGLKTEPNYFKSFPIKIGNYVYDLSFDGGGINTKKVVEKAIELRDNSPQKYDRVWAVFDKDSFDKNQFNGAIQKAKANEIHCAWSNEAFELWYLLHFQYRNTSMSRKDYEKSIENSINKLKENETIFEYKKNSTEMYSILQKYGNQQQATNWAKNLIGQHTSSDLSSHNPCTTVHLLVEELNGQSKQLNSEIIKKIKKGK
jgi:hypothetical protein